MSDKFDAMLQEIVNYDYPQLLAGAKATLADAFQIFSRFGNKDQATAGVIGFLASAIAIDNSFSAKEQQLIKDLFGDVDFMSILRTINADTINTLDKIVDSLPAEDKSTLCLLAIYVLAVDEHINKEEYRYLMTLID